MRSPMHLEKKFKFINALLRNGIDPTQMDNFPSMKKSHCHLAVGGSVSEVGRLLSPIFRAVQVIEQSRQLQALEKEMNAILESLLPNKPSFSRG